MFSMVQVVSLLNENNNEKIESNNALDGLFSVRYYRYFFNYTNIFIYMWDRRIWICLYVLREIHMSSRHREPMYSELGHWIYHAYVDEELHMHD